MNMKVGLEVSSVVVGRRSGVGNYVANMITGLQKITQTDSTFQMLYFSNRIEGGAGDQLFGTDGQLIYARDRLPSRAAWIQVGLPRSLARTQPDLCHFPNYLAPILRPVETPYLATMYDMSVYRCPQYQPYKTVAVHRAIVPTVAHTARLILTISESARQDILHYLKVDPARVRVVTASLSQPFVNPAALSAEEELELRARYNLNFPYLLSVGTLEPRKNHARLIEAFASLVRQERLPHHLVMVGGHGWKEGAIANHVHSSGLADRIHFLGYVPTADLPALYRTASAFAFPSLYEGFGLPVLEALACGTPCLISTDPALVEVAGSAAVVVNPLSVEEMAGGLHRLLTAPGLADTLREQGQARAAQFQADECAAQTYQLYQEVLADSGGPGRFYLSNPAADSGSPPFFEAGPLSQIDRTYPSAPIPTQVDLSGNPLEQAILKTLIYSDIFNFPLTLPELHRYLIGQAANLAQLEACLATSTYLAARITRQGAYLGLLHRPTFFQERQSQTATVARHWRAARRWAKWLRLVPFVRGAVVTGSLAADSAHPRDDIDLLLLVAPGRVWLSRALVIGLVYLARLQGIELCPNYLIAMNDEPLTMTQRDLYTARELAGMRLLFGENSYQRLMNLNGWLGDWLPNATPTAPMLSDTPGRLGRLVKKMGEKILGGRLGDRLEAWEQRKIARLGSQPAAEACFTPELCKGHFGNYGQRTLALFDERCAATNLSDLALTIPRTI